MSIQLASLFQDHAILQRGQPLPVWGWTTPLSTVRIVLGGHSARTLSNAQGDFFLRLPAQPAGGPHVLRVSVAETEETLEINDLYLGEVWLASGQSNMEWTLAASRPLTEPDIASATFAHIRFFALPRSAKLGPQRCTAGQWKSARPEIAGEFSAVAFSFARRLHRELGVPVGIISSSWGGSFIESWLSRSALALNPGKQEWLAQFENEAWTEERWNEMLSPGPDGRVSALPPDPGNQGLARGWHLEKFDDSDWPRLELPRNWQQAGHEYSGVFWFRCRIEIPPAWIGKDLELNLGAIDKQDISYINGIEVGRTGKDLEDQHWSTLRRYHIPASLVSQRTLLIAVRVYSFVYDGGLRGPAEKMTLHPAGRPNECLPLHGTWSYREEHNFGVITQSHTLGHGERNSPHILFDNMILPLIPYALRGAIWYQGESNASAHRQYIRLQQDLIQDWRRQWGQADFAFHLVQLPGFQAVSDHQPESNWAAMREAQATALALPQVGLAVAIDLGETDDIHPKNKIPVGERLAQSALALNYGFDLPPSGPIARDFSRETGAIRCRFFHAEKGLSSLDAAPLRTFVIAGEDRIFLPAEARIENDSVLVSHPEIPNPVAVRYAWSDHPARCNLANSQGLPAGPFRSDRW